MAAYQSVVSLQSLRSSRVDYGCDARDALGPVDNKRAHCNLHQAPRYFAGYRFALDLDRLTGVLVEQQRQLAQHARRCAPNLVLTPGIERYRARPVAQLTDLLA